jgi:hypothetical protein
MIGSSRTKQDFEDICLVFPQNKAKICPLIVTMPTEYGIQDMLGDLGQTQVSEYQEWGIPFELGYATCPNRNFSKKRICIHV